MSATVLSVEAAKTANIVVIENGIGTQAVHDVVVAMRAARRSGTACTKSKADVNLSGSKPWRQKGTGRARAGYKSSVVWTGGREKAEFYVQQLHANLLLATLEPAPQDK